MATQEVDFRPGTVIAGKYRCEREIGRGAMGVVVAATHVAIGQLVALKILHDASPDVAARFAREARLAGRLKGEHVARVIDAGCLDTGEPFIAMEFLDGKDLDTLTRERGALSIQEACSYVVQACEGLAEAHALGMVHRDVKPANLFLAKGAGGVSVIKVLDFGISKAAPMSAESMIMRTHAGALLGTPRFMSPEQLMSSDEVDVRSDVWSIGVVLYSLLSSHPPFAGTTLAEIFRAVLDEPMQPLDRREVPAELIAIIGRCLRKRREERYPNLAELAAALAPFAGSDAKSSVQRIVTCLGVSLPPKAPAARKPILVVATIALSITVGAAAVLQPWRPRTPRPTKHAMTSASVSAVALGEPLVFATSSATEPERVVTDAPSAQASATTRTATIAPPSTAKPNPDGFQAADRKFRSALGKPECLAAWDELRATPGYASSYEYDLLHGGCVMNSGHCDEGRAALRDAYRRPDARPQRSATEITTEVSGAATLRCPDGQLTNEELAWKKRMALGPALGSHDIVTATKYADELAKLLPTLPRGGRNEYSYAATLDAMCNAYAAAARCDVAKLYCTRSCTIEGGRVEVCVPARLGGQCPYP